MTGQNPRQQYYPPQKPVYRQPEQKHSGGGFSIMKLLVKIVFSPIIIVVIGLVLFQDLRKAILLALLVISAFNLLSLLFKGLKLFLALATFNPIAFFKTTMDIIIAIAFIAVYWVIYTLVYGPNFAL
jgi:hypothetical protein